MIERDKVGSETNEVDSFDTAEVDVDLDQIAVDATNRASQIIIPPAKMTWRMRSLLAFVVFVLLANAVVSVYNSIALRDEIECNHQLTATLSTLADQNRVNTKAAIDTALSGKRHSMTELVAIRDKYDAAYYQNGLQRDRLLKNTCQNINYLK